MTNPLSTVTSTAVSVALDALAQRQQLIAANIANPNSANYAVPELKFDDAFNAILSSIAAGSEDATASLMQLKQDLGNGGFVTQSTAQPVQMDAELVRLNETVIRYQA